MILFHNFEKLKYYCLENDIYCESNINIFDNNKFTKEEININKLINNLCYIEHIKKYKNKDNDIILDELIYSILYIKQHILTLNLLTFWIDKYFIQKNNQDNNLKLIKILNINCKLINLFTTSKNISLSNIFDLYENKYLLQKYSKSVINLFNIFINPNYTIEYYDNNKLFLNKLILDELEKLKLITNNDELKKKINNKFKLFLKSHITFKDYETIIYILNTSNINKKLNPLFLNIIKCILDYQKKINCSLEFEMFLKIISTTNKKNSKYNLQELRKIILESNYFNQDFIINNNLLSVCGEFNLRNIFNLILDGKINYNWFINNYKLKVEDDLTIDFKIFRFIENEKEIIKTYNNFIELIKIYQDNINKKLDSNISSNISSNIENKKIKTVLRQLHKLFNEYIYVKKNKIHKSIIKYYNSKSNSITRTIDNIENYIVSNNNNNNNPIIFEYLNSYNNIKDDEEDYNNKIIDFVIIIDDFLDFNLNKVDYDLKNINLNSFNINNVNNYKHNKIIIKKLIFNILRFKKLILDDEILLDKIKNKIYDIKINLKELMKVVNYILTERFTDKSIEFYDKYFNDKGQQYLVKNLTSLFIDFIDLNNIYIFMDLLQINLKDYNDFNLLDTSNSRNKNEYIDYKVIFNIFNNKWYEKIDYLYLNYFQKYMKFTTEKKMYNDQNFNANIINNLLFNIMF